MSFTYECDFSLQAQRLTPIAKRQDVRLDFLTCIAAPIQWNRDNFFNSYLNGDSSAAWDVGTNYVRGDRVNYQNKIYECIVPDDINGDPIPVLGVLPTDTYYWVQVVGDFRGATERIKYNCQKIILEYILNKWFGTTFVQPEDGLSDFYIETNNRDGEVFYTAEESTNQGVYDTGSVPQFSSGMEDYIGDSSSVTVSANFTVYYKLTDIPVMIPTNPKYYQMVDLVNKYKIAGSTVSYVSY